MACLILIMLYVKSEVSYDRFHEHKEQIYLLNIKTTNPQTGEQVKRAIGPYRELASRRSFSRDFPSDATAAFVINEAAVKEIGWINESAIGKTFGSSEIKDWDAGQWVDRDGKVIGVLKDFYF